ncbi:SubName: Full=Uncharacterized protein {ECO:0000313/EMBL:CCA69964.1} [Serendipita indica DSM 11827]|nr:SubName: Full=Uncharacterized protein {ECO:0000313/EMBL:CCA69964.1} [Serendipita indica DSM 11827]
MATQPQATPLQNMYYKRPVGTPKPCFICYRETRTVLWNPQDFLYTCDSHLSDTGFATAVSPDPAPSQKVTLSEDELKKIKEEWEDKQRKKKEKEEAAKAEKEKEKESGSSTSWLGWAMGGSNSGTNASGSSSTSPSSSSRTPPAALFSSPNSPPTHQKYVLNRQIFAMRQAEVKKKRNTSQANAIAPKLPIVPRSLS